MYYVDRITCNIIKICHIKNVKSFRCITSLNIKYLKKCLIHKLVGQERMFSTVVLSTIINVLNEAHF